MSSLLALALPLVLAVAFGVVCMQLVRSARVELVRLRSEQQGLRMELVRVTEAARSTESSLQERLLSAEGARASFESAALASGARVHELQHELDGISDLRRQVEGLNQELGEASGAAQRSVELANEVLALRGTLEEKHRELTRLASVEATVRATLAAATSEFERSAATSNERLAASLAEVTALRLEAQGAQRELTRLSREEAAVRTELEATRGELERERDRASALANRLSNGETELRIALDAKITLEAEVEGLRKQRELLESHLKQVGAKVVEEGGAAFQAKLNEELASVLEPVREDLQKMGQSLLEAKRDHSDEVKAFANLALALRGSSKAQGAWGEMVLERVLEAAGLREPVHYETQVSLSSKDGDPTNRPDVVVHLVGARDVIVDSKVSLSAFVRSQEATEANRQLFLEEHARALRNHVDELASRRYPDRLKSALDYVLMFVPNETALFAAYDVDPDLYDYATRSQIWLCSQTTLLPLLHIVEAGWRAEKANEAAREICHQAGKMVEKLQSAAEEFSKVRTSIRRADEQLAECNSKLFQGRGNVLTAAARVIDLGADVSAERKAKLRALEAGAELPVLPHSPESEAA